MLIVLVNVLLLGTIIYMTIKGLRKGEFEGKDIWISGFISLLIIPIFIKISTMLMSIFMPDKIALMITGAISFPLIYTLVSIVYFKLIVLFTYKFSKESKFCCAFLGAVKGIFIVWIVITVYAASYSDVFMQPELTKAVKNNVINYAFDYQVDFYRKLVFKTYHNVWKAKIDDLYDYFELTEKKGETKTMLKSLNADSILTDSSSKKISYDKYIWTENKSFVQQKSLDTTKIIGSN